MNHCFTTVDKINSMNGKGQTLTYFPNTAYACTVVGLITVGCLGCRCNNVWHDDVHGSTVTASLKQERKSASCIHSTHPSPVHSLSLSLSLFKPTCHSLETNECRRNLDPHSRVVIVIVIVVVATTFVHATIAVASKSPRPNHNREIADRWESTNDTTVPCQRYVAMEYCLRWMSPYCWSLFS